jgi:Antirestriction protein (ArdA).
MNRICIERTKNEIEGEFDYQCDFVSSAWFGVPVNESEMLEKIGIGYSGAYRIIDYDFSFEIGEFESIETINNYVYMLDEICKSAPEKDVGLIMEYYGIKTFPALYKVVESADFMRYYFDSIEGLANYLMDREEHAKLFGVLQELMEMNKEFFTSKKKKKITVEDWVRFLENDDRFLVGSCGVYCYKG